LILKINLTDDANYLQQPQETSVVTGLQTRTCTSFIVVTGTHTVYSSGTSSVTVL
jgi:hypothetical protein